MEENKFTKGCVFKIYPEEDINMMYISSSPSLNVRKILNNYKSKYKKYQLHHNKQSSPLKHTLLFDLFSKYNIKKFIIEPIERFDNIYINDLKIKEYHYRKSLNCINTFINNKNSPRSVISDFSVITSQNDNNLRDMLRDAIPIPPPLTESEEENEFIEKLSKEIQDIEVNMLIYKKKQEHNINLLKSEIKKTLTKKKNRQSCFKKDDAKEKTRMELRKKLDELNLLSTQEYNKCYEAYEKSLNKFYKDFEGKIEESKKSGVIIEVPTFQYECPSYIVEEQKRLWKLLRI